MLVSEAAQNLALRTIFIIGLIAGGVFCTISVWLLVAIVVVSIVYTAHQGSARGELERLHRDDKKPV